MERKKMGYVEKLIREFNLSSLDYDELSYLDRNGENPDKVRERAIFLSAKNKGDNK